MTLPYVFCGWAQGQIDPTPDAIALIAQGITNWREKGMGVERPFFFALLAETYERMGQLAAASDAIQEALKFAHASDEDLYRPELYRLQGSFLLAAGDAEAAHFCFQQALATARAQRAKSLELRAAMSLSLLWAEQGKRTPAYDLLRGVYDWFTEGFETADLRKAKELLLALQPL
jgi:predicted ATPase